MYTLRGQHMRCDKMSGGDLRKEADAYYVSMCHEARPTYFYNIYNALTSCPRCIYNKTYYVRCFPSKPAVYKTCKHDYMQ
jgi:hypothetical protein